MERRKFLGLIGGAVAGLALKEAIPFGRVWSFPKKIEFLKPSDRMLFNRIDTLDGCGILGDAQSFQWSGEVEVGSMLHVRMPQRFIVKQIIEAGTIYEIVPVEPLPFKVIDAYIRG